MAIWNLGSLNADAIFAVPRLPQPGETIAATGLQRFLGGKGANMSVAAARAGAQVHHIGAIGADGEWMAARLAEFGVGTEAIARVEAPSGTAIVCVDPGAENQIVILPGANLLISDTHIARSLSGAQPGDIALMQNETNAQREMAGLAKAAGLRLCYAAAPFDAQAVQALLPDLDLLIMNEVEASQLTAAMGVAPEHLGVTDVIVTMGAEGCRWIHERQAQRFAAPKVRAVDTTGAGDTFTGYLVAGLDRGQEMAQAIGVATRAAALMVTRHGTADVIPKLAEVEAANFDAASKVAMELRDPEGSP